MLLLLLLLLLLLVNFFGGGGGGPVKDPVESHPIPRLLGSRSSWMSLPVHAHGMIDHVIGFRRHFSVIVHIKISGIRLEFWGDKHLVGVVGVGVAAVSGSVEI